MGTGGGREADKLHSNYKKKREPKLPWFDLVDALGIEPSGP